MEELPFTAGLQIIDADLYAKGIERVHTRGNPTAHFDSMAMIDKAIAKLQKR
jgi:hypothetical protein